jgi:hypothetical protein
VRAREAARRQLRQIMVGVSLWLGQLALLLFLNTAWMAGRQKFGMGGADALPSYFSGARCAKAAWVGFLVG